MSEGDGGAQKNRRVFREKISAVLKNFAVDDPHSWSRCKFAVHPIWKL